MDMTFPRRSFNVESVLSTSDYSCRIKLKCHQGSGTAMIFQLSPAILFVLFECRAKSYELNKNRRSHMLEINYCISGRVEHILSNGSLQYLGKNDMNFTLESSHTPKLSFPLGYYEGAAVVIDLDSSSLRQTFPSAANLNLPSLADKLVSRGEDFALSMEPCIQNLHEIPTALPEFMKRTWLLLKVTELLIYLDHYPIEQNPPREIYACQQVEIIKDIHREITGNLKRRFTIDELSRQYYISATKLKNTFKGVYGEPIGSYMKHYRFQKACEWLRESEANVEQISEDLGYQSFSRFCAAFKSNAGCSPMAYRKQFRRSEPFN